MPESSLSVAGQSQKIWAPAAHSVQGKPVNIRRLEPGRNWFQRNSFHSAHCTLEASGLKPILKPTGRETMRPQATKGAETDLKYKGRRRHETPKFEAPFRRPSAP